MDTCCCRSWDSQAQQKSRLGQQTEKMVTCLAGLQKAPAQPQPSAQQFLLLPCCTQKPQSWDTLKMPRGNGSITANGSSGTCSRGAPLAGAGPLFLGMLSTALTASNTPPEPAQGDLSLRTQCKVFLFQRCLQAQHPDTAESSVPACQTHNLGHAAAQAPAKVKVSQRRRASRCHWGSHSLLKVVHLHL